MATVDNPYFPLPVGARWVYESHSNADTERTEVVVTSQRRRVMGVEVTVVRDTVTAGGQLVEDTGDWFAQDGDGNVWYFGEETKEYEGRKAVNNQGSWEAGVDGALPGIVMPARPKVGFAYRQEFYEGEAEDLGEVIRVGAAVTVPSGAFDRVVVTRDWNPLEPDTVEEKSYAPGTGLVLTKRTAGASESTELIQYTRGERP